MIMDPIFKNPFSEPSPLRRAIEAAGRCDEQDIVDKRLAEAALSERTLGAIDARATALVEGMRGAGAGAGGLDAFMHEFDLSNREGVMLMCLAEALLRIPDADTADKLIKDKIAAADWHSHLGKSRSLFVNASTWALMLTGRVMTLEDVRQDDIGAVLGRLIGKSGEPVIRQAMVQAMRIMGRQFVLGRTIEEALERGRSEVAKGYRYSFDMLGEGARTSADAERYFQSYAHAIGAIGAASGGLGVIAGPGISVKLSALHPRYETAKRERIMDQLAGRLLELCRLAAASDIALCVDAEEAARLDLSLDIVEKVSGDPSIEDWQGFGLAVQAYQKRAYPLLDWLADLARRHRRRFPVRLVKGAYWDTEIKRAQVEGLDGYPVFTRKASSDVSYLACAKRLLADGAAFYPQFATHNAHTAAAVMELAVVAGVNGDGFEFQRLHGMGESLFRQIAEGDGDTCPCRIYAPVGSHEDLLAYLVRRLLENGANSSFVNRIVDEKAPIAEIVADPVAKVAALAQKAHPAIPLPVDLFGAERRNSRGLDLDEPAVLRPLYAEMTAKVREWRAVPVIGGTSGGGEGRTVSAPADRTRAVGTVIEATSADVERAAGIAKTAQPVWDRLGGTARAEILDMAADGLEAGMNELMTMLILEAGKTIDDALAEVREAVDFCRYYGHRARHDFAYPETLPGPTGEENLLSLHGRGVFACISPWNFPLAIFTGQVAAALAAGNAVLAKPAEQTPLIAARAVAILHRAGVPGDILHLLPGDGPSVGGPMIDEKRVSGVTFTGSVEVAHLINRSLAARPGAIAPLIAETGGQNAMIVDSTALPEQVVEDAVMSAFRSAGQRCSALRVLFVQEDISKRLLDMLAGAVEELRVGDPARMETDVGPVIDAEALANLEAHAQRMDGLGGKLCQARLSDECVKGNFFAPRAYRIDSLDVLEREVFGPVLHVVSYAGNKLDGVIDAINATGYGLTFGVHTRVEDTRRYIQKRIRVGNVYVNRNMIGAVVGVQPFGGEGLSGTGPKAGGPRYLHRFACERTVSLDTTAAGGNAALMSLGEDRER